MKHTAQGTAKKSKAKKEQNPITSAVLLIAAAVGAVMLIVGGMVFFGRLHSGGGSKNSGEEIKNYFSALAGGSETPEMTDITLENFGDLENGDLEKAFLLYEVAPRYYRTCTVSHSAGENSYSVRKSILRDGDKYNIKTYRGGSLIETIISDGTSIFVRDETSGDARTLSAESVNVEEIAGLPNHSRVIDLIKEYGDETVESKRLSRVSFSMNRALDLNSLVLFLSFENGMTERYFYYLDGGFIFHCEKNVSGSQTYAMTTIDFDADISERVKDDTFVIPD